MNSGEGHIDVRSPFDGHVVGHVTSVTPAQVNEAVTAAGKAWREFRWSTPFERKSMLYALAQRLETNAEHAASLISSEMGKTIVEARNEVRRAQNTLRLSGDAATVLHGEILSCGVVAGSPNKEAIIRYEPAGIVAAITPFNYPLNLLCHKLGPAIGAGNTVVAKPSPKAPLTAALLAELASEAGFPTGVFTVIHGGSSVAVSLAKSAINVLSFTGGPVGGLALKAASGIVRTLMELGGNDPMIVMPDADLEKATATVLAHRLEIAGQSCAAVKRLNVHASVHAELVQRLEAAIRQVSFGDPSSTAIQMGPVINEQAAAEVSRRLHAAIDAGGQLVAGGNCAGTLFAPTLIDNVPRNSDLVVHETFGPVVAVLPFHDPQSVIEDVNDSPYGLQAGVFSNDHHLIQRFARELRVGGVMINEGPDFRAENVPFGGIKNSGLGREGVHITLREMSDLKIVIN